MPFFRIEMMPAERGDALLVEYGENTTRRLMIDGGPIEAFPAIEKRLSLLPLGDQSVELLVVTHVDTDHIEGIIRLLAPPVQRWPIRVEQIWFNGWRHIEEVRVLGGREGEFMSALIHRRLDDCWNTLFDRNAVRCGAVPDDSVTLEGGMKFTMLSPDAPALAALAKDWRAKLKDGSWKMEPGDLDAAWEHLVEESKFHPGSELTLGPEDLTAQLLKQLKGIDSSAANGSSIAFVAEYAGKSCAFLGDAHMDVVCASLKRLGCTKTKPLKLDAVKVAHHGSKHNLTQEFLRLVDAKNWLFSSNGKRFDHPNPESVEAVIEGSIRPPTLWFNYRTPFTERWEAGSKAAGARYKTRYPAKGKEGIVVKL
ncbi:hypothetical protein DB347_06425 [Opitutaceae bacterium EW11]|nr:hypothetical protein DB347_06425 [Opitutaceae bacterium EW11]